MEGLATVIIDYCDSFQVSSERMGRNVLVFERLNPAVIQESIRQSETDTGAETHDRAEDEL